MALDELIRVVYLDDENVIAWFTFVRTITIKDRLKVGLVYGMGAYLGELF